MDFYKLISRPGRVFVIAEAGVNHNGRLPLALRLVDAAREAGADAVKFQSFRTEEVISRGAKKAPYQLKAGGSESQFDMVKKLELSAKAHAVIAARCRKRGILFASTPCDRPSLELLEGLGVPFFKIGSGEVTNLPFLSLVASRKKPVVLSTGMSTLREVREAVETIRGAGNKRLVLLHCVSEYPTPFEQVNLRAMAALGKAFGLPVGYSDHTPGVHIPLAAAALGARVIEKHFTLSRSMRGPDHQASLDPKELAEMVRGIRNVSAALGRGRKEPAACERKNMRVVRRSVVARRDIRKGGEIFEGDLALKRPGWGIPPRDLAKVVGSRARTSIKKDEVLTWEKLR